MKGSPMNNDLISHTPQSPNQMTDLLERLDAQDRLNKKNALLSEEMTGVLKEVVSALKSQSESLLKIVKWIDSQPK